MGFEFKSDQEPQPMVDTKTQLSVNDKKELKFTNYEMGVADPDLQQITYDEGEEGKLAIQFLEENGLYQKFMLWQGIQEQLKKLREELAN